MIGQGKIREHVSLSIAMACASYVVIYTLILIHEMAHGCTALVLGGYFPFVQIGISEGSAVYLFPLGTARWKDVLVLLAGPLSNFLIAVTMMGVVATGIKQRQLRVLAVLMGGLSALGVIAGTGLLFIWRSGSGDIGRALDLMHFSSTLRIVSGGIWLLLAIAMVVSFFRLLFKELADFFPMGTYRSRFLLAVSAIAAPTVTIIGVQSISSFNVGDAMNWGRLTVYVMFVVVAASLLPLAMRPAGPGSQQRVFIVSPRLLALLFVAAACCATIQPLVLKNDQDNPSGLFLSRKPPEVTVSACNVRLTIREDYSARAQILMRPFVSQHGFLWEQVKNTEPDSWAYYDQFARESFPLMFGTGNFHIVDRRADTQAPFFNGDWQNGARVIEAEVDLSQLPYMQGPQSNRVLKIVDFWRNQGIGYLDFIEIKLEGSLQIYDYKSQPDSAAVPILLSKKQLQWQNPSFESGFAVSYLAIR